MEETKPENPFFRSFITTTLGAALLLSALTQTYFLLRSKLDGELVNPQAWSNIGAVAVMAAGLFAAKDANQTGK